MNIAYLNKLGFVSLVVFISSMISVVYASHKLEIDVKDGLEYNAKGNDKSITFIPRASDEILNYVCTSQDNKFTMTVRALERNTLNDILKEAPFVENKKIELVSTNHVQGQSIYCDITNFKDLSLENTVHKFHDAGYHHDANKHELDNVTFYFTKPTAGVRLAPALEERESNSTQQNSDPFSSFLINLMQNNSSMRPATRVKETCCMESIFVTPFQKNGGSSGVISGSIEFGDVFAMNLYAKNLNLTFTINPKFSVYEDGDKLF